MGDIRTMTRTAVGMEIIATAPQPLLNCVML